MLFNYAFHPFIWDTSSVIPMHRAPDGAIYALDYRVEAEQKQRAQTLGNSFFAWPIDVALPSEAIFIASGYIAEIVATPTMSDRIKTALGLTVAPSGATLADMIADTVLGLSDPTGQNGITTLMPSQGQLLIQFLEHSVIWRESYQSAQIVKNANPSGKWNRIRDVERRKLRTAFDVGGAALVAKCLGYALLEHGYKKQELGDIAKAKRGEWSRLLPPGMLAKIGGNAFFPVVPSTALTETFPNNCADIEATAQDYTWKTLAIDGFADTISVTGNKAHPSTGFSNKCAVNKTAVSSANHSTQGYVSGYNGLLGPCSRMSETAGTFYGFFCSTSGSRRIYKCISGTFTQLDIVAPAPNPGTYTVDSTGSIQTGICAGQSDRSVTDTANPSNLKGGFYIYHDTGSLQAQETIDTIVIDDHLSPYEGQAATTIVGSGESSAATVAIGIAPIAGATTTGTGEGFAPSLAIGNELSAGAGAGESYTPALAIGIELGADSATIGAGESYTPTLAIGNELSAGATAIGTGEGYAPTVAITVNVVADTTIVGTGEGYAPTVNLSVIELDYAVSAITICPRYAADSVIEATRVVDCKAEPSNVAEIDISKRDAIA